MSDTIYISMYFTLIFMHKGVLRHFLKGQFLSCARPCINVYATI